jgi:hypothetical protein
MITLKRNKVNCNHNAKRAYARSVLGIDRDIVAATPNSGLDALVWDREQLALVIDVELPESDNLSLLEETLDEHAATLTFLTGNLVTEQHLIDGRITWNGSVA